MSEHAISPYVSCEPARPRPDVIASTHGPSLQSPACLLATARTPRHHPSQPHLRPIPRRGPPNPFPAGFPVPGPPASSSARGVPAHSQDWRTEATPTPPGGLLLAQLRPMAGATLSARPGGGECAAAGGAGRARRTPRTVARAQSASPRAALGQAQCPELVVGPARGPCWPSRSSVNSCLPDLEDPSFRTTRNRPTWPRR